MENLFKAHTLMIKYETVKYIYEYEKHGFLRIMTKSAWNDYFKLIRGYPLFAEQKDKKMIGYEEAIRMREEGIKPENVETVKRLSDEEMDSYLEQLNCTPQQALDEYKDFIRHIKSGKEAFLKYIDAELDKDDLSEYAKKGMLYSFLAPGMSIYGPPWKFTRLDYLKVFKEFVLNDNEEVLPDGIRVHAYLKCGCKIP
jgi:hypothetical protein